MQNPAPPPAIRSQGHEIILMSQKRHQSRLHPTQKPSQDPGSLHLKVRLAAHDLGRIHRLHFVDPARRRHDFAHGAHLVGRVAGDANVVVALEHELDIADVELRRLAQFGQFACGADDVVDKVVGELEDGLG
jgi:hypothetical protein